MELQYTNTCVYVVAVNVLYEDEDGASNEDVTKAVFLEEPMAKAYATWCQKNKPDASLYEDCELEYFYYTEQVSVVMGFVEPEPDDCKG